MADFFFYFKKNVKNLSSSAECNTNLYMVLAQEDR